MNLLERVLTLLKANLNTIVEKADDPEKSLRKLQIDMRNQLVQVKTEVARTIAGKHTLKQRHQAKQVEATDWLKKAEHAVQQGQDSKAREALTHYNEINAQVERYHQQTREQDQIVQTLRTILRQLEEKLTEVDTTIDIILTRQRNAQIQQRVYEALQKSGKLQPKEPLERMQNTTLDAEARASALAELQRRDMEKQLQQISQAQSIEQQLQQMKSSKSKPAQPLRKTVSTGPLNLSPTMQSEPAEPITERNMNLEYLKKLLDTPQNEH
ncbi:MAG TPA: PspA/IM30 family protein [Dictyobacter sp.]|jgi:phage shock protein A|nr:PspA/IM30 family protein [Dictyobacter sp.]